jgi:hypothetical protein
LIYWLSLGLQNGPGGVIRTGFWTIYGFRGFFTEILSVQGLCYQTSTRRDQQFDVKIIPIFSAGRERCLLNHFYGF